MEQIVDLIINSQELTWNDSSIALIGKKSVEKNLITETKQSFLLLWRQMKINKLRKLMICL